MLNRNSFNSLPCQEIADDGTCLGEIDDDMNRAIFPMPCKPGFKKDRKGKCRKIIIKKLK